MKLKVLKNISKRVITLELETTSFTAEENKMLDILGEPIVKFEKVYGVNLAVSIDRRIRTGFKTKVKFDGTDDIVAADNASNQFLEDLPEKMSTLMEQLKELYDNIEGSKENLPAQLIDIKY